MKLLPKNIFQKSVRTQMLFFIIADIFLISLSIWLAFLLRFDGQIPLQYSNAIQATIVLALVFCLPIFYFLKLYSFSWSYVSTQELISLVKASSLGLLFLGAAIFISKDFPSFAGFPRSVLFISYFLILIFCGGIRFAKRIYLQVFKGEKGQEGKERTLIVGAEDAGEQILRSILASKNSSYLPLGFVDDNPIKQGVRIHGLKVLGQITDIPKIVKEEEIKELIITLPAAGSQAIKSAVEMGRKAGLKKIKVVPSMAEIINGQVSIRHLREIQIEDLLRREPVELDTKSIGNFILNKMVLVTGAAGSIGSELSRQVAKFKPSSLLLLDQDETGIFNILEEMKNNFPYLKIISLIADIRDKEKINQIFSKFQPNIIFHAAAYKHVPIMEEHPDEAVKNNIFGTKTVAETALKHRVEKFVFISTDKAINPTSVYGATKRVGEMICQVLNRDGSGHTRFISVRFGNVLDSRGNVVSVFKKQIKKGGPVKITHSEMKRYFMTTPEACLLVMQAGAGGKGGEVLVLDMGEPIKIIDLAKELIRLSGFEPDKDIPIVFTQPRPGEKFFEEILTVEEGAVATRNQKIFMAKLSDINENELNQNLEKLKEACQKAQKDLILKTLKETVPSYRPATNSHYELK